MTIPFYGDEIHFERAPEATDLIWENHDIEDTERSARIAFAAIVVLLILLGVFGAMCIAYKYKLLFIYLKSPPSVDCN